MIETENFKNQMNVAITTLSSDKKIKGTIKAGFSDNVYKTGGKIGEHCAYWFVLGDDGNEYPYHQIKSIELL